MQEYLTGSKLYGNDFTKEEIEKWFNEEAEAYADLGNKNAETYSYVYHLLNKFHAFSKLKVDKFENALGIGSAWGHEFLPIVSTIEKLTLLEPSEKMQSNILGDLKPEYVKPSVSGEMPFNDNSFDLITCFGVLHHIPNVSFVLSEILRVLKPGGYFLMTEPIVSMGDWTKPRYGLTKNERGIPLSIFDEAFNKKNITIVSKQYCLAMTYMIHKIIGWLFKKPLFNYKFYIKFDYFISKLLKKRVKYHARNGFDKIAPSSIFYVVLKEK